MVFRSARRPPARSVLRYASSLSLPVLTLIDRRDPRLGDGRCGGRVTAHADALDRSSVLPLDAAEQRRQHDDSTMTRGVLSISDVTAEQWAEIAKEDGVVEAMLRHGIPLIRESDLSVDCGSGVARTLAGDPSWKVFCHGRSGMAHSMTKGMSPRGLASIWSEIGIRRSAGNGLR
jgi:hypothetical protein